MNENIQKYNEAKKLILKNNFKQALFLLKSIKFYGKNDEIYEEVIFETGKIYMMIGDNLNSLKLLNKVKKMPLLSYSEKMIFDIYAKTEDNINLFKQYYKILKNKRHDLKQTRTVIDTSLKIYSYKYAFDFLEIYKNKFGTDKYIYGKRKELYKNISIYIQKLNIQNKYNETIKFFKKYYKLIPENELKIKNIFLNEYEIASGKFKLKSMPRQLTVLLTDKCNLQCIMCKPCVDKNEKIYELTDKNYNELIAMIPYLDRLILHGGEVFLYKNFNNILKTAKKNNVYVEIVTNGLLFDEKTIKILAVSRAMVTVSVDGFTKKIYEKIRKNAKFETLISKLKLLREVKKNNKNNLLLRLQMVVMKSNYTQIYSALKFAKKYLFDEVSIVPVKSGNAVNDECVFDIAYNRKILKYLKENRNGFLISADKLKIRLIDNLPVFNMKKNKLDMIPMLKYRTDLNNIENIKKTNDIFCFLPWKNAYYNGISILPTCNCPGDISNFKRHSSDKSILGSWNSGTIVYYRKKLLENKYNLICNELCINNEILKNERKMVVY